MPACPSASCLVVSVLLALCFPENVTQVHYGKATLVFVHFLGKFCEFLVNFQKPLDLILNEKNHPVEQSEVESPLLMSILR